MTAFAGYTYSQAEDKLMDETIMAMWADYAVWEIACAVKDKLGRRITARQVWGAHRRLMNVVAHLGLEPRPPGF
jgi:hypothetical protein